MYSGTEFDSNIKVISYYNVDHTKIILEWDWQSMYAHNINIIIAP